jgi:hypothetical protein
LSSGSPAQRPLRFHEAHLGAALLAGAAVDESAGVDELAPLDGDVGSGVPPPHAARAPTAAAAARTAAIAMFFMIVFSSRFSNTLRRKPETSHPNGPE